MYRSLVIRTAVNLSLIVLLTVQPLTPWIWAGQCDANTPAEASCRCCDETAGRPGCGCCAGDRPGRTETNQACCSGTDTPAAGEHSSEGLAVGCGCGVQTHPLGETSGSRPLLLLRDAISVAFAELPCDDGAGGQLPGRSADLHAADVLPPHFAQIQYGNWRL